MRNLLTTLIWVALFLALIYFLPGCAGVYFKTGGSTLDKELKSGGGWYWYDGNPTLDGCVKAWNANK